MKKYIINFYETELRFDTKEQAETFYKLNVCDGMDRPETVEINKDKESLMAWALNGQHPFEDKTAPLDWKLPEGKWIDLGNDKVFVENGNVIRAMSDGNPAGVYRWDNKLNCRTNVLPCKYETFRKAYREDRYTIQ